MGGFFNINFVKQYGSMSPTSAERWMRLYGVQTRVVWDCRGLVTASSAQLRSLTEKTGQGHQETVHAYDIIMQTPKQALTK